MMNNNIGESDRELLGDYVRTKNTSSFDALVQKYSGFVCGVCANRLGHGHFLIEDIVQTVFLVMLRKADQLQQYNGLSGWLYRTCIYVSKRMLRKEMNRKRWEVASEQEKDVPRAAPIEQDARIAMLYEGLNALCAKDRDVLLDHYIRRRSVCDMAKNLSCSETTLRKRLDRARIRLRKKLMRRGAVGGMTLLIARLTAEGSAAQAVERAPVTTASLDREALGNTADAVLRDMAVRSWFHLAARAALGCLVLGSLAVAMSRQPMHMRIEFRSGGVEVRRNGQQAWTTVQDRDVLYPGDRLRTTTNGEAWLRTERDNMLLLRERGEGSLADAPADVLSFRLHRGACRVQAGTAFRLQTDQWAVETESADFFVMIAERSNVFSRIDVTRGAVRVAPAPYAQTQIDPLRLVAGQACCQGPGLSSNPMPSDGREFSPRYGGVFYREYARLYEDDGFVLDVGRYREERTLLNVNAETMPEDLREAHALRKTFHQGQSVLELSRQEETSLTFPPLYAPSNTALQVEVSMSVAMPGWNFAVILDPAADWIPENLPLRTPYAYETMVDGSADLFHLFHFSVLRVGRTPDGRAIHERMRYKQTRMYGSWHVSPTPFHDEFSLRIENRKLSSGVPGKVYLHDAKVRELTPEQHAPHGYLSSLTP